MSNNQLNIYYRKDAEEEVKFKYEQEICELKRKIQISLVLNTHFQRNPWKKP